MSALARNEAVEPTQPSRQGETLCGKYRLDALLGQGGMGEVYRARNVLVGRDVAIKLLRREHAQNPIIVQRFMREATAANLVRHPNAVDIQDIDTDQHGTPFIVQELLTGEDLGRHLRRGAVLSVAETIGLLVPILDALAVGHANGVVHRDLKPDNVFLAREGGKSVPKLLDFGISQIRPQAGEQPMTQVGMMMGTPQYMSPEQVQGQLVDARTDVWAFGVMLYELLAGVRPFKGGHPTVFVEICSADAPRLDAVAPSVSAAIADVVHRCLQRDRERRFADAGELRRALVDAYHGVARANDGAPGSAPATQATGPKVPSLPPFPVPRQTAARAATPAPVPSWSPSPTPTAAPQAGTASGVRARGSSPGFELAYAPPPSARPYASSGGRPLAGFAPSPSPRKGGDSSASLVALLSVGGGVGLGCIVAQVAFDSLHLETLVAHIEFDSVRYGLLVLFVVAALFGATRGYLGVHQDPDEKSTGAFLGAFAAMCAYAAIKLLG
jgi:serine/threonine protein kinase